MIVDAIVRKALRVFADDAQKAPSLDPYGAMQVSQLLPPLAQLNSMGALYIVEAHAGTAVAPVVAPPTTSPQWGLYNYSADKRLYLLRVSVGSKSGTTGLGLSIFGAAAIGPQTQDATDYAGTIKTCCNGSLAKPEVVLADNPTLLGDTPGYHIWECTRLDETANIAIYGGLAAQIDGALLAEPRGGMVAIEVVGATGTTALFTPSFLIALLPK